MEEREIKITVVPPISEGMRIVCLKSNNNNKFLRYRYEDIQTHGLLQFAADNELDLYSQFEVQNSTLFAGDGLVHLKSRYNNKYLVRCSPKHHWITATANIIDENKSSWSCTLFKPIYFDDNDDTQKMRLVHVQLGHYACLWRLDNASFDRCLFAGSRQIANNLLDVFTFVNWESLFNLPKHVAFKGENGKYLGTLVNRGIPYLQFMYDNLEDPNNVAHEIFQAIDGTLSIKSSYFGKFWRLNDDEYIVADANDPRGTLDTFTMFRYVRCDVNVISLINMVRTCICKCFSSDGVESYLNASSEDVDRYGRLEVIDLGTLLK